MADIDLLKGAKGVEAAYPDVLTQWQVYKMVETGQLPVIRKGRRLYFRRSDIEASFKSEIGAASAPHDTGDVIPLNPRSTMPLAEAKQVLASIGYRQDWTTQELIAAVPRDMLRKVEVALRVVSAACFAEARELEAEVARRRDNDR